MDLSAASALAIDLMDKHGLFLRGWSFDWSRKKRAFGTCCHTSKQILLSRFLTPLNDEAHVRNTILHEIAHAITGPGHNHDSVWKINALSVGAVPRACSEGAEAPAPYVIRCVDCGATKNYFRRPKYAVENLRHTNCVQKPNCGKMLLVKGAV